MSIDLKDFCPRGKEEIEKAEAKKACKQNADIIDALAYRLYAESKRSLLIVLQGMDTAGKDGVIRNVMNAINPQCCHVFSFKQPTPEEAAHDFLWRVHKCVPQAGRVAIFNRSYYEDVLVVKVHGLGITSGWGPDDWLRRYNQINDFERILSDAGTTLLKIFLHISKDEQKERLQARVDNPDKRWKVCAADVQERKFWDNYQTVYGDMIGATSTALFPWHIIAADRKWYRDYQVSKVLRATLETLDPQFPKVDPKIQKLKIK